MSPARRSEHDAGLAPVALGNRSSKKKPPTSPEYVSPLEQLVVSTVLHPSNHMVDLDFCESRDAFWEDKDGRLPHDKPAA